MMILTGTCASGKTTTAEVLMSRYGFVALDSDCVRRVIEHKTGLAKVEYNGPEMFEEILNTIDILLTLQKDIALSHVILPNELDQYHDMFEERELPYMMFVLQPNHETAVARSQTRTCWPNITPEKWVRYFHDEFSQSSEQLRETVVMYDNSHLTAEESADEIVQIFERRMEDLGNNQNAVYE